MPATEVFAAVAAKLIAFNIFNAIRQKGKTFPDPQNDCH